MVCRVLGPRDGSVVKSIFLTLDREFVDREHRCAGLRRLSSHVINLPRDA